MKLLLTLAFRNVWRNSRRTLITIMAVVFATLLSIAMRGIQLGTYEENISFALKAFSGFLQLQAPGYQDNPSLHKSFVMDSRMKSVLAHTPHITGWAPRLNADGLASHDANAIGVAILGVSPAAEQQVTTFPQRVVEGRFLQADTVNEVVIGFTLLKNLKCKVGDDLVLLAQRYDGTLGNERYTVVGTLKTGTEMLDGGAVLMPLPRLQDLLGMENRLHIVAVALDDVGAVDDVTAYLNATLDTSQVNALPWQTIMPELKQAIQLDNVSGMIFLGILIVVVAFGILNTMLMSITERFREFGVLLSLGMPNEKLALIVLCEMLIIIAIGISLGNLAAWGVNYYLVIHPVEFTGDYKALMESYGWLPVMRSSLHIRSFINTTLSIVGISLLSVLYPIYRTFNLEPLKGIRYT
jgi:putative ABC transport system permease protein